MLIYFKLRMFANNNSSKDANSSTMFYAYSTKYFKSYIIAKVLQDIKKFINSYTKIQEEIFSL